MVGKSRSHVTKKYRAAFDCRESSEGFIDSKGLAWLAFHLQNPVVTCWTGLPDNSNATWIY